MENVLQIVLVRCLVSASCLTRTLQVTASFYRRMQNREEAFMSNRFALAIFDTLSDTLHAKSRLPPSTMAAAAEVREASGSTRSDHEETEFKPGDNGEHRIAEPTSREAFEAGRRWCELLSHWEHTRGTATRFQCFTSSCEDDHANIREELSYHRPHHGQRVNRNISHSCLTNC